MHRLSGGIWMASRSKRRSLRAGEDGPERRSYFARNFLAEDLRKFSAAERASSTGRRRQIRFVHRSEFLGELLKAAELSDLASGLVLGSRRREILSHSLLIELVSQSRVESVARVSGKVTVAPQRTATSSGYGD